MPALGHNAARSGRLRASIGSSAAALVAGVGLALVTGCGSAASPQSAPNATAAPAPQASRTPANVTVVVTTTVAAPAQPAPTVAAPAQPAPTVAAPSQPAPKAAARGAAPPQADEASFWQLIAETRRAAGVDTGRQTELLKERLTRLSPQAIIDFARIRHRLDQQAYTWSLWGAAYVVEDGCSDDCFRDFRAYVISLGRGPYENALRNPDSLASVAQNAETGDWESADNVAPDAYSSVTGSDFPLDDSDLSGRPRGTPFNENDPAGLARRYPRLAARFR